ncbi:unnamed protein product [Allacma fusca]|uniref:Uncharacterized protein n=1 Tax=Allacma fusca TaxID=39272 RepID=A0A8J2LDY5_9HEXA|nr:unnamed protein product [Allacma fusca]
MFPEIIVFKMSSASSNLLTMDSAQEINSTNFYQRSWTKNRRSIKLHQCLIPIFSMTSSHSPLVAPPSSLTCLN